MAVILTTRRRFLVGGGAALLAAPAILRAGVAMPIKPVPDGVSLSVIPHPHNPLSDAEVWRWFSDLAAAVDRRRAQYGEGPMVATFGEREATFPGAERLSGRDERETRIFSATEMRFLPEA